MNVSRRTLLAGTAVVGGGLVIGLSMRGGRTPLPIDAEAGGWIPNAFLQVTPDNVVRFYCPRDEMGQGVTTGLTTLIAEELDVDPHAVVVELAMAHPDYANPEMGVQATGGSNSIKAHWIPLREAGARARAVLLEAASAQLGVPVGGLRTEDGAVISGGERHPYGEFVAAAADIRAPEQVSLKPISEFRYIGKESARLDGVAKATGTAVFGIDIDLPDLHHAVVVHPPVTRATVKRFDAGAAASMPGVIAVVPVETGIAVVARKYWQARQAAARVEVEWNLPELARYDSARIRQDYDAAYDTEDGNATAERGDLEAALTAARHVVDARYWAPYLAHAPMEPMNATVRIENGEADVWTGSQGVGAAQGLVARYAGISVDRVRSHNTLMGGSFGRRATLHHVIEATQAARATGKPVQVLWSREDDMRNGVFRPASLMGIKAGVDADGVISAWHARRVGGNFMGETLRNVLPGIAPTIVPVAVTNALGAAADTVTANWMIEPPAIEGLFEDYDLPNRRVTHVTRDHGLPLTFWRSVGHSHNAFATESMIDELAAASGIDPVELRLRNTRDNPRLHAVVRIAGERMRAMRLAPGHAVGMAAHSSFNSYVAEVAEVSVDNGQVRVHNVLCVVDCGIAVNPNVVRAQMEGGVMFALTAALHGEIELDAGAVRQSNFHDYPILRMNEAPSVEVVIVDSNEAPTGVGEPGVPPLAPAVANAVFAATGKRLRSLPLRLDEAVA